MLKLIIPQRACPNKEQSPVLTKDLAPIDSCCLSNGEQRPACRRLQCCAASDGKKPSLWWMWCQ